MVEVACTKCLINVCQIRQPYDIVTCAVVNPSPPSNPPRVQIAQLCQREVKKTAAKSQRASKEASSVQPRARRLMREALIYWRKYEKVEREARKEGRERGIGAEQTQPGDDGGAVYTVSG